MKESSQFTEGKILAPLVKFAIPVLLALCLQAMYGAIDLLVVGQFGSPADVSAVATGSQMMQTITNIITGLSMGTTILLGQMIGMKKSDEAGNIIGSAICFFAILAVAFTVCMMFVADPFAVIMQAPAEAFDKTVGYVRICSGGLIFIVAYNVLGSIFRGLGDSKTPLITVAVASAFNVVGDLLFVAVFHLASAGAALATVMAQALSVVFCFLIIRKRGLPFPFSRKNVRFDRKLTGRMVKLGFPIALQDGLVSVSFLVLMAIINDLGVIASAGIGVAQKLCSFIMLVPSSFAQSLSAFVAQNIGAEKPDRARKSMLCGMAVSFLIGIVMAYASFFHGDILAGIFARDGEVILAAADYLKAYAIDTLLVSFLFCFIGYFNGCGKTFFVMAQGLIGAFAVRIPVAMIMSRIEPVSLFRVGLAIPISTVVQITVCVIYFVLYTKKHAKDNGYDNKDDREF